MKKHACILIASLAAAPFGAAQEAVAINSDVSGQPAWYETFTLEAGESIQPSGVELDEEAISLNWAGEGRWSVNLDVISRTSSLPILQEEMKAGASYNFTPRFSVGGALSVETNEADKAIQWTEQELNAGVRLETSFKF